MHIIVSDNIPSVVLRDLMNSLRKIFNLNDPVPCFTSPGGFESVVRILVAATGWQRVFGGQLHDIWPARDAQARTLLPASNTPIANLAALVARVKEATSHATQIIVGIPAPHGVSGFGSVIKAGDGPSVAYEFCRFLVYLPQLVTLFETEVTGENRPAQCVQFFFRPDETLVVSWIGINAMPQARTLQLPEAPPSPPEIDEVIAAEGAAADAARTAEEAQAFAGPQCDWCRNNIVPGQAMVTVSKNVIQTDVRKPMEEDAVAREDLLVLCIDCGCQLPTPSLRTALVNLGAAKEITALPIM